MSEKHIEITAKDLEWWIEHLEKMPDEERRAFMRIAPSVCRLALESLKAPAVTTGEGITKIKAVALKVVETDCQCGADDYPNGSVDECYGHEILRHVATLSAPAPLSSEAVGKALKLANELVESDPRGLSADQHSCAICGCAWVHADSCKLLALKHALALLTPSPNEKEKP